MTADHLDDIEQFDADLWKMADSLRANSGLASNEYFMPAGAAQIGERPRTAEADLPSDPAHDSDAGAEEGNSEGRSGTSPAFPCGHNDRRVYAGNPRERAGNRQRDQC